MAAHLKNRKILLLLSGLCIIVLTSFSYRGALAKKTAGAEKGVNWISFSDAVKLNQAHPKKIFIDVYTSWCGWCKKMDASTYTDPEIISYMNKNFYAVRLDAETKDTFYFNNHTFVNANAAAQKGSVNELPYSLLDGKMMYPTTVYLDEKFNRLTVAPGYLSAPDLKTVLYFFGENKYKTMSYDDYKKQTQPQPIK